MKFFALTAIAATLIAEVSAHTRVYNVLIDGNDYGPGAGSYIRQPPTNDPVKDLTSPDIRCNTNGYNAVPNYVPVPAGSNVTTVWYHNTPGDDIIDASHHGPIFGHLAPAESNGVGQVWVEISQDGYSGGSWAVDKLRANEGHYGFPIPTDLEPGKYILRAEVRALHEADALYSQNPARGAQFYPSCIQIEVIGCGDKALPSGVVFPGYYTDAYPGIKWSLYDSSIDQNTYPLGPAPPSL